jgi:DNA helicase HerA-like ATPase
MKKYNVPQKVLAQHTAILRKTGSGKTSTRKLAVEQVEGTALRSSIEVTTTTGEFDRGS